MTQLKTRGFKTRVDDAAGNISLLLLVPTTRSRVRRATTRTAPRGERTAVLARGAGETGAPRTCAAEARAAADMFTGGDRGAACVSGCACFAARRSGKCSFLVSGFHCTV